MEREFKKKIRNRAFTERNKGQHVKLVYQKLIVDGEVQSWRGNKGMFEIAKDKIENDPKTKKRTEQWTVGKV